MTTKKTVLSPFIKGIILAFIGAILFSSKAIFVKLAYAATTIDATSLLALRMFFAFPFYLLTTLLLNRKTPSEKFTSRQWLAVAFLGLMGYYVSSMLDFLGLQYVSAGIERLILYLYPTLVVIINYLYYKEKPAPLQLIALAIAYAGILFAFLSNVQTGHSANFMLGSLLIFICSITFAIYTVGSSRMVKKVGSLKFTSYAMLFATLGIMVHFLLQHQQLPRQYPAKIYWISFNMAIFATVIPTFLSSEAVRLIGANNSGIVSSIGPISTIILAYLFLGETLTLTEGIGTVLVMAGVLMIGWRKK